MKRAAFLCFFILYSPVAVAAANLVAEINMDIRAATASKAKAEASEAAIRSGAIQILSRYSDRAIIENLISNADDDALQNLVASVRISNEKTSKTAYAARFSITLDRGAVEKWYGDNNVLNFLGPTEEDTDRTAVYIEMSNGINDWVHLNQVIRESGESYGLALKSIFRNNATASIIASKRRKFQGACAGAGWSVSWRDGIVRISK